MNEKELTTWERLCSEHQGNERTFVYWHEIKTFVQEIREARVEIERLTRGLEKFTDFEGADRFESEEASDEN